MEPSDATHRTILPRMSFDSGDDLDLTAFLQEDDIGNFLANDGASGSAPALNNELVLSNISPPEATTSSNPTQRQRQERRGHTKSRRGCYNCKRRRIKVFTRLLVKVPGRCGLVTDVEIFSVKKLGLLAAIA